MLTGTGRIVVAIAGAVAVVVAGVFIVRGLVASPPPKLTATKSSSAAAKPAPVPPGASPSVDPGAAPVDPGSTDPGGSGSTTGSSSDTSSSTSSSSSSSSSPPSPNPGNSGSTSTPPFTETTTKSSQKVGLVTVDVDLPQVQGGKDTVAQTFNTGMQAALTGQADLLPTGKLKSDDKSGVRIGKSVLSGLLHTAFNPGNPPATTSIAKASTVVVDINSGSTLDVTSIFTDTTAGLKRLQTESQKLGPTTSSAGNKFSGTNLQADQTTFRNWTAEAAGMRVLFQEGTVAPSSMGVVELTIPWANLQDLLKPGMVDTLSS